MTKYILPAAAAVFLLMFLLGLPDLTNRATLCVLEEERHKACKAITGKDLAIMLCITLLFGFVDFSGLGNRESPETFIPISRSPAVLTQQGERPCSQIAFFTGVGYGEYVFESSEDCVNYTELQRFSQDAAAVLKWQYVLLNEPCNAKYLRITCNGDAWLGEAALLDADSSLLPFTCDAPELCDEQAAVCLKQDYMNSTFFDEIYHARTAWENLNNVYPYEISHPPLGKLIISLGISLFGMTPFGWRFSGTLFGILMLPVLYIFVKRMFGSTRVSTCATLVFATDFMHFVQTRIATIDTYAVFFTLLMYLFLYEFLCSGSRKALALSGVFFGIGAASKWTCIYAGAGLAVLWGAYWVIQRRKGAAEFFSNALFCIGFFVIVPCLIYYVSYIPYGRALEIPGIFNMDYLNTVLDNQKYMFEYHSKLVAEHPYSSMWYQWVLDIRPILYYLEYFENGTRSSFGAILNPLLCWGGLLSLFVLVFCAIYHRDGNAAFILVGYFAQLVPWMFVTRLTFEYHYFPCSVFLVLGLAYVFRLMENSARHSKAYLWSFVAVSGALFILFYPVLSGRPVRNEFANTYLEWLPTWPF